VVVAKKEDVPIESSNTVKDGSTADSSINRFVDSSTNGSTELIEAASDINLSTVRCENKKRKQFGSSSSNVDSSCNNLHAKPCGNIESCNEDKKEIVEKSSMAEISAVVEVAATIPKETHVMQQSNAKKQKIEYGLDSLMKFDDSFDKTENSMKSEFNEDINDSFDISTTHDTSEYPKQTSSSPTTDEEQTMSLARRPKVSIGSTDNGGRHSSSDSSDEDSEMDVMIAQGSMWNADKKSEEEDSHLDDDDDDSDIVCLGTSSESQLVDETCHSIEGEESSENNTNLSLSERSNFPIHEDLNISSLPEQINSPKKDVCYICGTDLTRIKSGLKGRVAHMKRCSAKYGETLGARRTMNNDGDDADFVEWGTERKATALHEGPVSNPYKQQWHGDASSELALNKGQSKETQQKSQWKELFKKPVRSLTNVLMSGARQASKVKAITTNSSSASSKSGKKPYRRGQWSSNNSKRTGSCPSFKRITHTDFICDGFQYACKSLSENYFLTHFHSDHYGGIGKTWSEGTIYCSLPTANLVHTQLGVDMKYLHPLPSKFGVNFV